MKIPPQSIAISSALLQIAKFVCLSLMPEHRFAKDQAERHFVDQGFQSARSRFPRARRIVGARKIGVGPSPEVAMAVSTIVSLNSEPQRIPVKTAAIERDVPGKKRVGMRCSGESNPAFVAQRETKCGLILDIPGNRVAINFQRSAAGILADFVVADSKMEWILPSRAEIKARQRKSLNE